MQLGNQDAILCSPADIVVTSGSDFDLTVPFNVPAFGSQAYARGLINAYSGAITVVVVRSQNSLVVGGSTAGIAYILQPGEVIYGNFATIINSGSSFSTGNLVAFA